MFSISIKSKINYEKIHKNAKIKVKFPRTFTTHIQKQQPQLSKISFSSQKFIELESFICSCTHTHTASNNNNACIHSAHIINTLSFSMLLNFFLHRFGIFIIIIL